VNLGWHLLPFELRCFNRLLRENKQASRLNPQRKNVEPRTTLVTPADQETVAAFLTLGRDYLKELSRKEAERFFQSILKRQREPKRWLVLLKRKNEWSGFTHVKIDENERPG
jgi:uncharacterized protein HemY